jgi:nitroreductase
MDVFEAVDSRLSCRAFLDRPVDPALVRDLIERAPPRAATCSPGASMRSPARP